MEPSPSSRIISPAASNHVNLKNSKTVALDFYALFKQYIYIYSIYRYTHTHSYINTICCGLTVFFNAACACKGEPYEICDFILMFLICALLSVTGVGSDSRGRCQRCVILGLFLGAKKDVQFPAGSGLIGSSSVFQTANFLLAPLSFCTSWK